MNPNPQQASPSFEVTSARREQHWFSLPDTVSRYMRAAKGKFEDEEKRIKGTMEWRMDI
jgi:hypothetical protein